MTARLELLQLSLAKQSQDMEAALYKSPPQKPDKQRQPVGGKYLLRTDIRCCPFTALHGVAVTTCSGAAVGVQILTGSPSQL